MAKFKDYAGVRFGRLFLGTQADNVADMFAKGRARPRGKALGRIVVGSGA